MQYSGKSFEVEHCKTVISKMEVIPKPSLSNACY